MDIVKVFQERDVVSICNFINNYCEVYINKAVDFSKHHVKSLHEFFPTLLIHIFGSPTIRGWIQTETHLIQDNAIKELLSVNSQFFRALLKLNDHPDYSIDLLTDSLPSDVRNVLSSGSLHLLPRVYRDCYYLAKTSTSNAVDIRAAATRQSSLIPPTIGGQRKIKYNMLQFYLYYFVSLPTWPPLTLPTQQSSNFSRPATTIQQNNSRPSQYSTVRSTAPGSTTPNIYQIPGTLRSITKSPVYNSILEEYLSRLIPLKPNDHFDPVVKTFFLDACVELWIRSQWVVNNQKLSKEYMHYVTTFVQYIVQHDLKQCVTDSNKSSTLFQAYGLVKDELYTFISRLAVNWNKNDDYLLVVELWSVWAAPWKLGAPPKSSEKQDYSPIQSGWSLVILDNLPFYLTLVDIILQGTSAFVYKESVKPAPNAFSSITNPDPGTIRDQLRTIYRIINVLKAHGLVDYLGLIEKGFERLKKSPLIVISSPADPFKRLSMLSYGSENMDHVIQEKLHQVYQVLAVLDGNAGVWKPKGVYSNDIKPRSDALLKTLSTINNAALTRGGKGWGNQIPVVKNPSKYADQLNEVYTILYTTFKVVGNGHLNTPITDNKTTTKPRSAMKAAKTVWIKPFYVGNTNGGFLTEDEIRRFKQGKALSSYDNIHAVGDRAITYVRSYEIRFLVRWTVQMDVKINQRYNLWLPVEKRPAFLPKKLTLRPFASQVNMTYTIATLLLLLCLFFKMIF